MDIFNKPYIVLADAEFAQKVCKIGTSRGIIIPKIWIDQLNIKHGDIINVAITIKTK